MTEIGLETKASASPEDEDELRAPLHRTWKRIARNFESANSGATLQRLILSCEETGKRASSPWMLWTFLSPLSQDKPS